MERITIKGYCPFLKTQHTITVNFIVDVLELVKGTFYCGHKVSSRCPLECPIHKELPSSFKY